uniref:Uncharacterized protein n=1 Tax=Oryza sativa subsp. japonica TaxID=39947 RepID=Q69RK9_ORYSJ|nr:hypothetical protein [Oryza sativa Japonica Group]
MGRKDRRSEEVPGQHRAEEAEVEELGGRGGAARRAGAHSVVVAPSKTKTAGVFASDHVKKRPPVHPVSTASIL